MNAVTTLAQAIGLAYSAGVSVYATVAVSALAMKAGWVDQPPGALGILSSWWVIGVFLALYAVEFTATLIPGVASAWETLHSVIRPPAAAALAAATAWHADPLIVLVAAVLGGGVAVSTHATKLGFRYAIDTSPEPVTNGAANVAELSLLAGLLLLVWEHPFIALAIALAILVALMVMVRLVWRVLRQVFSGRWMPGRGLLQDARTSDRIPTRVEEVDWE